MAILFALLLPKKCKREEEKEKKIESRANIKIDRKKIQFQTQQQKDRGGNLENETVCTHVHNYDLQSETSNSNRQIIQSLRADIC